VAQRTGATTYYIELLPVPGRDLGGRRPVLALTPGIGDIDMVVASELMEASRALAGGFVTPDRTMMIASTSRFYTMNEKIAMADGRYDQERLLKAIGEHAQSALLLDLEAMAKQSGAMINAVLLGMIAASGRLPIPVEAFEAAIRADGKAVEGNLRGFHAGLQAARQVAQPASETEPREQQAATTDDLEREIATTMPAAARDIILEGTRRLTAYQDCAYGRLYLDRLAVIREADQKAGADGRLLRETARHLALRMSFEDVIRVAEAKIDPARMQRIREEMKAAPGEPFAVYEFLKPGIEEMCQVLPGFLARPILKLAARRGWLDRFHWGMQVNTGSVSGYLRFRMLAGLKRSRRMTYRYREEQAAIVAWLGLIADAARLSPELAMEVAECARLIKGYGDTLRRGMANYRTIATQVIAPVLSGATPVAQGIDAIASARTAALVDPEGESLARCLADLEQPIAYRIAAE
jgi:indolepyruvate ferredoxin oxidoreductase beta subunit